MKSPPFSLDVISLNEKTDKAPFVCNGCDRNTSCRLDKAFYKAATAHRQYSGMDNALERAAQSACAREISARGADRIFHGIAGGGDTGRQIRRDSGQRSGWEVGQDAGSDALAWLESGIV